MKSSAIRLFSLTHNSKQITENGQHAQLTVPNLSLVNGNGAGRDGDAGPSRVAKTMPISYTFVKNKKSITLTFINVSSPKKTSWIQRT